MKFMEKIIVYLEFLLKKNNLYNYKWQKEQSEEILGVEFLIKDFLGKDFLGKDFLGKDFLVKNFLVKKK